MRNNIFKVVFALLLSFSSVFGADGQRQTAITEADIFVEDDKVVDNADLTCRKVKDEYITRITGYNFEEGIIECQVVNKNNHAEVLDYQASQKHLGIISDLGKEYEKLPNEATKRPSNAWSMDSNIRYADEPNKINFTRFLSALVTLDPSVFDFQKINEQKTVNSATLQSGLQLRGEKNGKFSLYAEQPNDGLLSHAIRKTLNDKQSANAAMTGKSGSYDLGNYQNVSTAEGMNQANLTYFVELFTSMNEIYKHLQNLLFIVIGGWFVGTIGTQKFLKYLEHKGEGSGGNQPYLHKFLIPILGVSFFFAPIPEGNLPNQSTTIVQNIIRYFTATGNQIADMAGSIGAKVYMQKLYNRTGGISQDREMNLRVLQKQEEHRAKYTHRLFNELCRPRFPDGILHYLSNEAASNNWAGVINQFDVNKVVKNQDITAEVCLRAFLEEPESTRKAVQHKAQLAGIEKFFAGGKNELQQSLKIIDNYIVQKDSELGWFNSILLPGTGLMVEVQDLIVDNSIQNSANGNDAEAQASKVSKLAVEQSIGGKINPVDEAIDDVAKVFFDNAVYLILPGSKTISDSIKSLLENGATAIGTAMGGIAGTLIGKLAGSIVGSVAAPILTIVLLQLIITYIPACVATMAAGIAFLSYIVGLCKYFYISPFVVAFSITTKRQEKIIDFLLSGVSIFFKPILIVLFIYLSLFLHTLVADIIVILSTSQFAILTPLPTDIFATSAIGAIRALMHILASIASCYIMWKLIIKGPDWVMDLIGIKGGQDTIVSDSLAQNLERRSMMIH